MNKLNLKLSRPLSYDKNSSVASLRPLADLLHNAGRFGSESLADFSGIRNHVHLLLESSDQPLARFMQGLQQSYTQYFNRVHGKVGHLFQGRYKAIVCEKDEYLLTLIRYVHLNPVRAKLVKVPEHYKWSGHRAYLGQDNRGLVDSSKLLEIFGGRARYRKFVLSGIEAGHRDEYYAVKDQRFLGTEGFGEKLCRQVEKYERPTPRKPLVQVFKKLAAAIDVDINRLSSPDRGRRISKARVMIGYVLIRRCGFRVKDVASFLARDPTTLSVLIGRFAARLPSDLETEKILTKLSQVV